VPSALPGVRQPVKMHGMGCVAEIGDPASLAGAILKILDEAEKFKGNPAEVARQYDPDTVAIEYEKLFKKLMEIKR
jgi:glycosyltransferase involved in cell wall biosynthesis